MKHCAYFFLCMIFLVVLAGCGESVASTPTQISHTQLTANRSPTTSPDGTQPVEREYVVPTVDPDFWELLCENCDISMYFDTTREGHLMFWLVAVQEPAGKTMTITTDTGHTSEVMVYQDGDPHPMEFSFFLMYQDFDWESLKTDPITHSEIRKAWWAKYEKALSEIPTMYCYRFYIPLKALGIDEAATEPQQLKTLTVTLDGQTKTYDLGKVQFLPGKVPCNYSLEGGLEDRSFMRAGYGSGFNKEGHLKVSGLRFVATKDVVLQGISFPGSEGVTVASCEIVITTPFGDKFNMTWDAYSPIEVDEGSEIQINLIMEDPVRANTLIANTIRYLSLDYSRDGVTYGDYIYMSCSVAVDPYFFYEWCMGGVDVWKYLFEYKDMLNWKDYSSQE